MTHNHNLRNDRFFTEISKCYKLLTLLFILLGLTLNTYKTTSVTSLLSYYTSQSNILCLLAYIYFVKIEFSENQKKDRYYILKGAVVIAILITTLVYHLALAPIGFEMDALKQSMSHKVVANLFVHTISPLMVIFDYIIWDEKGHFKRHYPLYWICFPFSYVVYVYLYSSFGGEFFSVGGSRKFAYFFLDYTEIGIMGVFKWIVLLTLAIFGLSYILIIFDSKKSNK